MKLQALSFLKSTLIVTSILSASASFAADKAAPGSGPNPFSDCGIGAALFPETKWAAVTSNVIWDIGLTAVTSATASPETCSGKTVETAVFINRTYDELVEETAQGQGEHITAMLDMIGCSAASQPAAMSSIRQSMVQSVTADGYNQKPRIEKASAYYDIMSSAVSQNCTEIDA